MSEKKWAEKSNNSSIMYFDVTNLYGYAMTFPLPVGGFELWYDRLSQDTLQIKRKEMIGDILQRWTFDDECGYVFEVDVDVPFELHDKYNELPFLAERYNDRLVPTLLNKTNYRVHLVVLRQALEKGLVLKEVHKVLKFKQKRWLKEYIEHNTRMRAETKDENMRNFYKLMNNAVYGKTM